MDSTTSYPYYHYPIPDFRSYAVWLVTLLLVAFGFRYAKDVIVFVLDKLYDLFVAQHGFQP